MDFNTKDIVAIDLIKSRKNDDFVNGLADNLTKQVLRKKEATLNPFLDMEQINEEFTQILNNICETQPIILRSNNFHPALNDHRFYYDTEHIKNLPRFISLDGLEDCLDETFKDGTCLDYDSTWGYRGLCEPWQSLADLSKNKSICNMAHHYLDYFFDDVIASVSDKFTTREEYEANGLYILPENERYYYAIDLHETSMALKLADRFAWRIQAYPYGLSIESKYGYEDIFSKVHTVSYIAFNKLYRGYSLEDTQITTGLKEYFEIHLIKQELESAPYKKVMKIIEREERNFQSAILSDLKEDHPEILVFTSKMR